MRLPRLLGRGRDVRSLVDFAIDEFGDEMSPNGLAFLSTCRTQIGRRADAPPGDLRATLLGVADHASATDRPLAAIRLYEGALELEPDDASVLYNLGNNLHRAGRRSAAIDAYGRALRVDPQMSWASYMRGLLRCESGRADEAFGDFEDAARHGCDLDVFYRQAAWSIIPVRGFVAFVVWFTNTEMPMAQRLGMMKALERCLGEATAVGGWFLASRVEGDPTKLGETLSLRARLADILRESPCQDLVGKLSVTRSHHTGYHLVPRTDPFDLLESMWYRPADWGLGGPEPDRAAHLTQLEDIAARAHEWQALEAGWAAHYASGAIALSALLGERLDWPTPVWRLGVPCTMSADGRRVPVPERVSEVDRWLRGRHSESGGGDDGDAAEGMPDRLSRHALEQFRAAADALLALNLSRTESAAAQVEPDGQGEPAQHDGEFVPRSRSKAVAYELWGAAEPVIREWVDAARIRDDSDEFVAAVDGGRRLSALATTELWTDLSPARWRAARDHIVAAYRSVPTTRDLRAALGEDGLLVDYFMYEIVQDAVMRLDVGPDGAALTDRQLDPEVGELRHVMAAHDPGTMPPEGFGSTVAELLLGGVVDEVASAGTLVIAPFRFVSNVPIHAFDLVREAVDRGTLQAIAYLPATALLASFGASQGPPAGRRCLFVGYDPSGDIDVDGELAVVRRAFPDTTILRDGEATLARVLAAMPGHDLLHIACHGAVDEHVCAGYVELAGERLYAWHIVAGPRTPATVVMNACLTSNTEVVEPTSDAAFGLHSAFLLAGSRHVVGALWEVNEWSARHFARAFYDAWLGGDRRDGGVSPAMAVVRAQRALRAETEDPFLWAPHALFGDWR